MSWTRTTDYDDLVRISMRNPHNSIQARLSFVDGRTFVGTIPSVGRNPTGGGNATFISSDFEFTIFSMTLEGFSYYEETFQKEYDLEIQQPAATGSM